MDTLSRDELTALVQKTGGLCLSIYMPTHRSGPEVQQDSIRLRNLLHEAEERLVEAGLQHAQAKDMLRPARDLLDDRPYWQHLADGLALFISQGSFRHYRLPLTFEESVALGERPHIDPLVPLLTGNGRFFILALSLNEVRLFEATHLTVRELELPEGTPTSLDQALRYDEFEQQRQYYSGTPAWSAGRTGAVFFGQGVGSDQDKNNALRYFHLVDGGVRQVLHGEHAPLVLAGVEYLQPIYREANTYPQLIEPGVRGNPEGKRPAELREEAWALVRPRFEKAQHEAVDRYLQFSGTGQTSNDILEIVPAAYYGQVDTLFIARGVTAWGTFNPDTRHVELHDTLGPGDEDLLDFAAVQTLLNRGTVYATEQDRMPDDSSAAALLRY